MTKAGVLDSSLQKAHEWLRDIKEGLGIDDDRAAYAALRATLHGLRDLLGTDQVARFGAQLPMLVRGIYYEGWNPSPTATGERQRSDFLEAVRHELRENLELRDAERVARIVFDVITMHLTTGEIDKTVRSLPREIRALWPQATSQNAP